MFDTILEIFFIILLIYCSFSSVYFFVFSLAALFARKKVRSNYSVPTKRIAILVPAYKEDNIILSTARNFLNIDYPEHYYDIYIIADSFQFQTIQQLKQLRINVIEVSFENSTKIKSLNQAFRKITKQYDIALIFDADNICSKDFLKHIDFEFSNGAKVIQGRRVAKNLDTNFAVLDGLSEAINNHIFRKGANALGLSSALIGSGMAFEFDVVKKVLSEISAVGGFDKPLQLKIVESGITIKYLEDALVFDEKIDNPQAFKQQKKRWLLSQFTYLKEYFVHGCRLLVKRNFSYFNLAVLNNVVPPRVFLIFALTLFTFLSYFIQPPIIFALFIVNLILYFTALAIAVPKELISKKMLLALLQLPKAIFLMFSSLFTLRKAKNVFIHTVHTKNEISNPLYKK
jgi:cellulose synthase/poly-beta-1,6-N-acetylglucosamine synthase-like glycosyltransferase